MRRENARIRRNRATVTRYAPQPGEAPDVPLGGRERDEDPWGFFRSRTWARGH
jgi:hypothetical protein